MGIISRPVNIALKHCAEVGGAFAWPDSGVLDQQLMLPPRSSCVKTACAERRCWPGAALVTHDDLWMQIATFVPWIFLWYCSAWWRL